MNKTMKIVSALMIVLMLVSFAAPVFATTIGEYTINPTKVENSTATSTFNKILGMIKYVGIFLAVGLLMFMGIKYMLGSVEEKAEYKKTMIPLIVGVVLLFSAAVVIQIVQGVTESTIKTGMITTATMFLG